MPVSFVVVPTLPVLVPVTASAFALLVARLWRTGDLTVARVIAVAAACVYGAAVLAHVLLPYPIDLDGGGPSWRVWLHLTPFVDVVQDPIGIVLNAALFVPLGVLVPLLTGDRSLRRAVTAGFVVSLAIEVVQFLSAVTVSEGRVADVDDLIGNTVGTLLGYALYRLATRMPAVDRAARRVAWSGPSRSR